MRRATVGIILLLLQLVAVAHARSVASRWLAAWAPNDYAVWYRLEVSTKGGPLSTDEVVRRYGLSGDQTGAVYQNPAQNMIDLIRQYEQTYGRNDQARVVLWYRPNGRGPIQVWRWPEE